MSKFDQALERLGRMLERIEQAGAAPRRTSGVGFVQAWEEMSEESGHRPPPRPGCPTGRHYWGPVVGRAPDALRNCVWGCGAQQEVAG